MFSPTNLFSCVKINAVSVCMYLRAKLVGAAYACYYQTAWRQALHAPFLKKKNYFYFFFLLMYCCELSLTPKIIYACGEQENTNNDAVFPTVICAETGRQAANQQQTGNLHLHAVKPGEKHQRGIQRDCGSV